MEVKGLAKSGLVYIVLIGVAFTTIFPFFWMVSMSFQDAYGLYNIELIPRNPTISAYIEFFKTAGVSRWFLNTGIFSGAVTASTVFFSSLAGYAFARKSFPGRNVLFLLVISTIMIPIHVRLIPLFIMLSKLHWINTYQGLILPMSMSTVTIFLMRQYMMTIPRELEDAAIIDGCSEFAVFWRIIMPLCKPAVATITIFSFMGSWNDFLWPLIITTSRDMRVLTVGLALFQGMFGTKWGLVMAGSTISFLPVIIVFVVLQKHFIRGITLTGLKL